MKNRELHAGVGLRNSAAWVWGAGILFVIGLLVLPIAVKLPADWELFYVHFPGSSVFICFLLLAAAGGAAVAAVLHRTSGEEGVIAGIPEGHPHRGITMHHLRFGGGVAGLIFTVGSMLIFLIGVPAIWAFLVVAAVCGIVIAAVLQRTTPRRPLSLK